VSSTKDGGAAFITRDIKTDAGKVAPTKLKHLTAHAMDPLQSLAAQQGMSALSAIDISTGFVETTAPPVAGTRATETAIRAAKIVRMAAIGELSGDMA
jgi:predicted YcjX-like family ATPase